MSSVSDDLSSEAAEVLGIVSRLVKPIRQAELRAAIAAPTDCGADRATELAAAPSLESSVRRTPRRVLLAEDNPVNRMLATEMLALLGCDVTHAENGSEALAALERGGIEVVLMDCQMPVMDGLTATREWRAREAQRSNAAVRIVALTANALTGDRDECLLAGMNDFLAKPYTLAQLRGVLRIAPATAQASATAYSAREVLDVETLETVLALDPGGQGRLFTRLRAIYEKDAMRLVEDLAQAAAAQDFERVAARAHTLKSASANVGALRLAELAAAIETDARAGQGLPGGRTEHLRQELGLALDALRAYSPGRAA
jgi:CheY-like chemotaxis protein